MDNVTASIIIACQTAGAVNSISKLGFALSMLGRKAIEFGHNSIQIFSDLQEETQKFGTVFEGVQNQANDSVQKLMDEFGQSELSARRMMAQVGDLLKGTGMDQHNIAAISGEVSKLGSDITSFANYSQGAEQATFALVKAMLGETEMAKSLGVFIKTDTDEFKKLEKQAKSSGIFIERFGKTFKASTTVQARAYASLAMMFDQKGYVLGDFSRNINSIANQSRVFENSMIELRTTIGSFLDQIIGVGNVKGGLAETINKITATIKKNGHEWAYYIASFINSTRAGFELIFSVASKSIKNIYTVGKFVYEAFMQIWNDAPGFFDAAWEDIKNIFDNTFDYFVVAFRADFEFIGKVLGSFLTNWQSVFKDIWEIAKLTFKSIITAFVEIIKGIAKLAASVGENFWDLITGKKKFSEAIGGVVNTVVDDVKRTMEGVQKEWEGFEFGAGTKKFGEDVANAFMESQNKKMKAASKIFEEYGRKTTEYLAKNGVIMGSLVNPFSDVNSIIDEYNKRQIGINARRNKKFETLPPDLVEENLQGLMKEISSSTARLQQTAQSATFAGSLEAARLQSRMMLGPANASISDNPQKTTAEQSKKQVALLEELRNRMDTIISGIGELSTATV